jgi:hypothetical protein
VFEAPALVAGFDDFTMMGEDDGSRRSGPPIAVKQGGLKFMQSPDHEFRVFKAKARREDKK